MLSRIIIGQGQRVNLTKSFGRRLSSSGSSETKTTLKMDSKGKSQITETIIYAKNTWSTMSPLARRLTYVYVGCMTVDNVYGTYQGGKDGLEQFRYHQANGIKLASYSNRDLAYQVETISSGLKTANTEWQATYYGCRRHMFTRFLGSTVWPIGIFSRMMPAMVMWMNPPTLDQVDDNVN